MTRLLREAGRECWGPSLSSADNAVLIFHETEYAMVVRMAGQFFSVKVG